ncbi:fructosamine kinase family protein [Umezakia ovalisporum]|jgi:fructosamine-3-kinase|uniref:fructosamine kinase family protein n=1 Tax=Umezakia ovalisporum TaxID=75695 RepID=UPI0024766FAD|nr:fructosamine kinase family protein [Umezakia ovalisporum]MBI1242390.1 phosphotransferase [Nostoc sp. RI_552]MDH6068314.1 fructosamine kinase family protein [Umezakia ovalisporum APH033B]MDH6075302.1 fructosamine kinase family protein [Umezakia ovalisporum CS-1034]MDH6085510.1 fructosamine kinase family protein [Umezakia ovalisporum TAC611]MDH6089592.1 fructosamine kinase family protein [Umezakia ovalisporum Ak1311]
MWTEIDTHISEVTGAKFQTQHKGSVRGGCINEGYAISDGNLTYFVKLNRTSQLEMFAAEALGLQEILATNSIRVPKPICWGAIGNCGYIVLEWLEMGGGNSQSWLEMGRKLAAMHKVTTSKGFGWKINNIIGSTPQINTWTGNWGEFYSQYRLSYQFELARERGGSFPRQNQLLAAIPELLASHDVQPCLVHGDLWGGNARFIIGGEPVIFDPAIYFGHREVDIAMTELFGGFPSGFYQGYNEVFPLDPGYEQRKTIYNLYHILNHFNLFGGDYGSQGNRMIDQILHWALKS